MTDEITEYAIDVITGGVLGGMSWFWGGWDGLSMMLVACMAVDQFSGLAAGWVEHKLSSEAGFKGILKKCVILMFVGMAHLMDKYILTHTLLGDMEAVRNGVCLFYIGNEGISIIENADRLGIPFPEYIREHFLNLRKGAKKEEKEQKLKKKQTSDKKGTENAEPDKN